jgi:enoyl-CoA hydratase/carnithine racemase
MITSQIAPPLTNMSEELLVTRDVEVLTLKLNRPKKHNALGQNLCKRLFDELALAKMDSSVKVVVLTGGDHVFSSGHDLSEFSVASIAEGDEGLRFIRELAQFPKPIIAAVHGAAVGVGFALLLHCDFVFVASSAQLTAPFIRLGIGPQFGMSYLLPRKIGDFEANRVLFLGKSVVAPEAVEIGLANAVLPDETLFVHAMGLAKELSNLSLLALMTTKQSLKGPTQGVVLEAIDHEAQEFSRLMALPETKAILQAALPKRRSVTETT